MLCADQIQFLSFLWHSNGGNMGSLDAAPAARKALPRVR